MSATFNDQLTSETKSAVWPVVYRDVLEIGDPNSSVAICTLWTHRKTVARLFNAKEYAVIGNLYGLEGISPILRNIFANPRIRYIVLWGNDLSESGNAIVEFMREGVDENNKTPSGLVQIEREIDLASIAEFRAKVELIDLRGQSTDTLKQVVKQLPQRERFTSPRYFPLAKTTEVSTVGDRASEVTGFRLGAKTIAETWLQIVYAVMLFGKEKYTKYGNNNELREILNLTAVITEENPAEPYLPHYMLLSAQQLEEYYPQVLEARHFEGTEYSYGERLRAYEGIDQIEHMINALRKKPSSKRLFATTWKVHTDSQESADPPCLTQLNGAVQDNRFYLTAHFRSQDMFAAWPLNAFAIRKLQAKIADEADIPIGPLTMVTHSAHIYAWDWSRASSIIPEYEKVRRPAAEIDFRGYVIVSVLDSAIEAKLYSLTHKLLDKVAGKSARKISLEITRRMWTADSGHAIYLGIELMKAEIALRAGAAYVQDAPLELPLFGSENDVTLSGG